MDRCVATFGYLLCGPACRLPLPVRRDLGSGALVPALRVILSDVEELLTERGIEGDHVTVFRWVQRFTPPLIDAARPYRHVPGDASGSCLSRHHHRACRAARAHGHRAACSERDRPEPARELNDRLSHFRTATTVVPHRLLSGTNRPTRYVRIWPLNCAFFFSSVVTSRIVWRHPVSPSVPNGDHLARTTDQQLASSHRVITIFP